MFPLQLVRETWWTGPWTIGGMAIAIVIIAGIVALVTIALRKMGITIPDWVIQAFWVVVVVIVIVCLIKLLMMMFV